jgi:hypothetical protein
MLSDTHPDAERVQIELLRLATPEQRLDKAISLTHSLIDSSRRRIAAMNPTLDQRALSVLFVETYYGTALAAQFRDYLEKQAMQDHVTS